MKNDLPGVVSSMLPVDDDKLKEFANVDVTNLTERRYLKVMFLMLCYIFLILEEPALIVNWVL